MSRCAPGCQRPPRSCASSSRTSSQTCSESTSTPSRSKTTASITAADVPPVEVDERSPARARLERPHRADEDHVVAGGEPLDRLGARSSRPRPRAAAGRPRAPGSRPTGRAAARCARSAARGAPGRRRGSRPPTPPASSSTSKSDADRASEIETSGGSSETRDERRDRQPGLAPARLGDDDRHPGRPAPEERPLLVAVPDPPRKSTGLRPSRRAPSASHGAATKLQFGLQRVSCRPEIARLRCASVVLS